MKEKKERESNLRRQRLASPPDKMLVAQTTRPVQKNRLCEIFRTDTVEGGSEEGERIRKVKKRERESSRDEPALEEKRGSLKSSINRNNFV